MIGKPALQVYTKQACLAMGLLRCTKRPTWTLIRAHSPSLFRPSDGSRYMFRVKYYGEPFTFGVGLDGVYRLSPAGPMGLPSQGAPELLKLPFDFIFFSGSVK